MGCEIIREKFSSLLEGDLSPLEEQMIKEHLSSCPACQKDFETFKKTIDWLHSVDQVEAPDGFLTEMDRKIIDRKRMGSGLGWAHRLSRVNLPAQAVAMVAIVFVVLYMTKIIPLETIRSQKADKPIAFSVPSEKKTDEAVTTTEVDEQRGVEQKKAEPEGTSATELKARAPEERKAERTRFAGESPSPASVSAPIQEIVLRTSDPARSFVELQAMVEQLGGEILKEEENVLLASLPAGSLPELKKEIEQRRISKKTAVEVPQRDAPGALKLSPKAKEEVSEKEKEVGRPMGGQEGRMTVRILLIQE